MWFWSEGRPGLAAVREVGTDDQVEITQQQRLWRRLAAGPAWTVGVQGGCAAGLVWEVKDGALQCLNASVELNVRVFDLVAHDARKSETVTCYQV